MSLHLLAYSSTGMHAREWMAPASALYMIDTLVQGREDSEQSREKLLDLADWVILPLANPDGYAYTWSADRNWRKNRWIA